MSRAALIIVDYQNDFLPPDGALAVAEGRDVQPVIEDMLDEKKWKWDLVVATQASLSFGIQSLRTPRADGARTTIPLSISHSRLDIPTRNPSPSWK